MSDLFDVICDTRAILMQWLIGKFCICSAVDTRLVVQCAFIEGALELPHKNSGLLPFDAYMFTDHLRITVALGQKMVTTFNGNPPPESDISGYLRP